MSKGKTDTDHEWENICARCGRCCYEKIDFEGRIYYTEMPCNFLDQEKRTCRVYYERDTMRPDCLRLTPESVKKGFLPADCPYVKGLEGYVAPSMPEDD